MRSFSERDGVVDIHPEMTARFADRAAGRVGRLFRGSGIAG